MIVADARSRLTPQDLDLVVCCLAELAGSRRDAEQRLATEGLDDGLDPLNRLAVLEGIVLTTGAALREAPADPVINNYHLTALGQREALIRQIERMDRVRSDDEWF